MQNFNLEGLCIIKLDRYNDLLATEQQYEEGTVRVEHSEYDHRSGSWFTKSKLVISSDEAVIKLAKHLQEKLDRISELEIQLNISTQDMIAAKKEVKILEKEKDELLEKSTSFWSKFKLKND